MTKPTVNYGWVHFVGSIVFAMVLALLPTVIVYKITGTRVGVLLFLPVTIVLTRLLLWIEGRVEKENADSIRRRYKAGHPPLGK